MTTNGVKLAAVVGFLSIVIFGIMAQISTLDYTAVSTEDWVTYPPADAAWYEVGAMPLLLTALVVVVLSIIVSYLVSIAKVGGKNE